VPAAKKNAAPIKKRFKDWVVVRKFDDESGFGDIYEVKHAQNKLDRAVVKTIKYDHKPEHYQKLLKMFHQEAVILRNLKHKNICKFREADFESDEPWFAMDLYRGNNILQDLVQYGPAPESIWFDRARDILEGLAYAHSKNVMHGDLNPKNVIIDGRGAKLIDFGIARLIDPKSNHGTYLPYAEGWQSPEHARTARKVPMLESDIFVLASLLTYFGTGQYPFKPDDTGDHQESIDNEEANYSTLSTNQKLLLKPMHEKSPKDRISAVDALALLEKLRPSAGARPIVQGATKPVAVAKPVAAQPAVKAPVAEKVVRRVDLPKAEPKVPKGIELLPNGARVAGWKAKEKRPSLADMPASYWLLIATILTAGLALIPWGIYKFFARNTKTLEQSIRIRLAVSIAIYLLGFGLLTPFVTWWWARRIGYLHLKIVLGVQSLLTAVLYVDIAVSGNEPSPGWVSLIFFLNFVSGFWSYSVIREKLSGKPKLDKKSRQAKKEELASVVTGGHQSWDEVKETFRSALAKHQGSRFIIEILSAEYTDIYFQGYSEPDGAWTIEAAADLAVRPHLSEDQKVKMSMIGWDRPSEGLPNFIMFLEADESEHEDLAEIFTKSLRDGYGLSITKFRVMAKDR